MPTIINYNILFFTQKNIKKKLLKGSIYDMLTTINQVHATVSTDKMIDRYKF